ncbi:CD36 [Branchiostoma belcheri]|nr:CD36 [Branchiostoma belcheri]
MAFRCTPRRRVCCGVLGMVCLLGGVVGLCLYNMLLDGFVSHLMSLRKGEFVYGRWKDPPYPIYMQFYFFNLLNKDEVLNGAKPAFQEKGPYTYREVRHKVNVTFNGNDTVSYVDLKSYSFVPRMSAGTLNDTFTSINIAAMTLSEWFANERDVVKDLTSLLLLLSGEPLFVTHTVGEMLAGYHEPLLTLAKTLVPEVVKDDTFGIFRIMGGQTNASDGVYTVYTGRADPSKYTYIDRWNGMREVNFWNKTGTCNMINGTVGTMYPIIHDKSKPIYVFQSDMCRSVHAVFESEQRARDIPVYRYTARPSHSKPYRYLYRSVHAVFESEQTARDIPVYRYTARPSHSKPLIPSVHAVFESEQTARDIPVYRYTARPNLLQSGDNNPDNRCFCLGACLPDGLMDGRSCHQDPRLLDTVWGLQPDKLRHQTFLDIEPTTGLAMNVARRVQINMDARPVPHIRETEKIRKMYFPVMWLSETALIDTKYADLFKSWGLVGERGSFGGLVALTCLGAVTVLAVAGVSYRNHREHAHFQNGRRGDTSATESASANVNGPTDERTSLLRT